MVKFGFGAENGEKKNCKSLAMFLHFSEFLRGGIYRVQELMNCTIKPLNK